MKNLMIMLLCFMPLTTIHSVPYIPESMDSSVAKWKTGQSHKKINTQQQAIDAAEIFLKQADSVGKSYLYALAQGALQPYIKNNPPVNQLILWAKIQQHKHLFEESIVTLNQVLTKEPHNINANLMLARIHVIKKRQQKAKSNCIKLLRSNAYEASSICLLEVGSHQNSLADSYQQLIELNISDAILLNWKTMLLAEMSYRMGQNNQSEQWLESRPQWTNVNYLTEWSDIKLLLNKPEQVLQKLTEIIEDQSIEDSLLLRLALAEQQVVPQQSKWRDKMAKRVQLRELRQDIYHASDMARFYLDIKPNSQMAKKWALINWQQAQEYKDQQLLKRTENSILTNALGRK